MRILDNPHCGAQPNFEHFELSLSTSLGEFGRTLQCGFSRTRTAEHNQNFMHFYVPLSTALGGICLDSAMRILENTRCGVQPNFHAFWRTAFNVFERKLVALRHADSWEPALRSAIKLSCADVLWQFLEGQLVRRSARKVSKNIKFHQDKNRVVDDQVL